jgi:hypothetical protein
MATLIADRPPRAGAHNAALRALALRSLERMYDRDAGQFVFCVRKADRGVLREGLSDRYTAITIIGLAGESPEAFQGILGGASLAEVATSLVARTESSQQLGDLALTAWAGALTGCDTARLWERILTLGADSATHPTVDVAWTLSAATIDQTACASGLAGRLARRLLDAAAPVSGMFPHHLGEVSSQRDHVSCFADLVYPTLALAQYGEAAGDPSAVAAAARCADTMCRLQGPAGQWWWHFDYRTGRVLEKYPVYAVHQDAMAPMALFAAARAAGTDYSDAISRGLAWLWRAPELDGRSLVDHDEDLIWRKVARREPAKLSRYLQAAVSRVSSNLRAPGLDPIFPPTAIDYEDRPYHLGWLLYAWPAARAAAWPAPGSVA